MIKILMGYEEDPMIRNYRRQNAWNLTNNREIEILLTKKCQ